MTDLDLIKQYALTVKKLKRKYLICFDLYSVKSFPGCCETCHEDNLEFDYDLLSVEIIDGIEIECCCIVQTWLNELIKNHEPASG